MQTEQIEITRERDRTSTETERLHRHIRLRLAGQRPEQITRAIETANEVFRDGAGHMQTALDAALASVGGAA